MIIDTYAYYLANEKVQPELGSLIQEQDDQNSSSNSIDSRSSSSSGSSSSGSQSPIEGNAEMTIKPVDDTPGRSEILETLTDDMCLLANPWVKGLDLRTKEWGIMASLPRLVYWLTTANSSVPCG